MVQMFTVLGETSPFPEAEEAIEPGWYLEPSINVVPAMIAMMFLQKTLQC